MPDRPVKIASRDLHIRDLHDRALGALVGGALGDALGMPTQTLSPAQIRATYGRVTGFLAPSEDHPVSRGLPAGAVTDDTEQTLLLAEILLASGSHFDDLKWVEALIGWEDDVRSRGSYDLLGPSTKRAIDAIRAGAPAAEAGRHGDTNGAAMRIAPVGLLMPPEPLGSLIDKVAETCRATHSTGLAIAAAAAVAAAVSCGLDGGDWRAATTLAGRAAAEAKDHGHWVAGADISERIGWAVELAANRDRTAALQQVIDLIGTSVASQESVPAAFAVLAMAQGDAWQAAVLAANLGGDTDTIGAIAATMAGARAGFSALPGDNVAALRGFDLAAARKLAEALVERRQNDVRLKSAS
ncbi:ADP-ribosylglycohydrolase family protein [Pelagibius sp. CAU 1746]|uniref:ADP-ribosylglycohydrolase family protein n=1 Tax=Pelagibius sp. CAU 1746 TaxID=3140370 RepID=UPI00325B379A